MGIKEGIGLHSDAVPKYNLQINSNDADPGFKKFAETMTHPHGPAPSCNQSSHLPAMGHDPQ